MLRARAVALAVATVSVFVPTGARADLWAYVDEQGRSHVANRQVDARYRLFFKGDMMPPQFHEGLLTEALIAMNVKGTVTGTPQGPDVAEYILEWS